MEENIHSEICGDHVRSFIPWQTAMR
jgi:hypothetical protein